MYRSGWLSACRDGRKRLTGTFSASDRFTFAGAEWWKWNNRPHLLRPLELSSQGQDFEEEDGRFPQPSLETFNTATGPSSQLGRDEEEVAVVLWSLTSPYHFSSPAIDCVSVGRRTDKGMCMTLPTDTAETPRLWRYSVIHSSVCMLIAVISCLLLRHSLFMNDWVELWFIAF